MTIGSRPVPARHRLGVRLVLATLLVGLVSSAVGVALLTRFSRASLRRELDQQNLAVATELAGRIDERIADNVGALRVVATRPGIISLGAMASEDLRTVLRAAPIFDELVIHDASGTAVAAAANRFMPVLEDYSRRPDLLDQVVAGTGVDVLDSTPSTLELAVPIEEPPGTPIATLVASAPLDLVAAAVERVETSAAPVRSVVGNDDRILVHPDRDRVADGDRVDLGVFGALPGTARLEINGSRHIVAAAPLARMDGVVMLEQREAVALGPVEDRLRDLVVILVLVMATVLVGIGIAGRRLLAPLGPLAAAVNRLGRGERTVRVDETGTGEVRRLAEEFNRLVDSLEAREVEVSELQRLSLLLNRQVGRPELEDQVVAGTLALLHAQGAQLIDPSAGDDPIAAAGQPLTGLARRVASRAARVRAIETDNVGEVHVAAVPVGGRDDTSAAIVVVQRAAPWSAEDLLLASALAAVAGVALGNVRRLELEQQLTSELQDAVDRRRNLLATVTHEFRTPLVCIEGFSSSLLQRWDDLPDEKRIELVGRIHRNSTELDELVSRLLDFSVAERGSLGAQIEALDLQGCVAEAIRGVEPLLAGRELGQEIPPVRVLADRTLLRRTMTNLLSNAAKYSAGGTAVRVRAVVERAQVRVEVIDEGVGMTSDEAAQAFRPFWRAGSSTRGAGIGLSLVAEYVRVMGGRTGVVSEPGRGSTFFFTLPVAVATATQPPTPPGQ